jgi:SAM-dependent methyltransferase
MNDEALARMDGINRRTWKQPDTIDWFRGLEGFTDPGERGALARIADEARDQPILDIGVGGGRTVPLLRAVSEDYTAIDYTEELVEVCRAKYPGVNVSFGDARDLSRFADRSFRLVVFSFNGIDAVNVADRAKILSEVRRVLRDDGVFFFSAHNSEGPGHGERLHLGVHRTRNPIKLAARFRHALARLPATLRNRRELSKLEVEGDGYAIANASAHDHGLLIHYISLDRQLQELRDAGFQDDPVIFGNRSETPISASDDTRDLWWFHFLARARSIP